MTALVNIIILLTAFALDTWLGDPRWLPHLIVGYGKVIGLSEKLLNSPPYRFFKGMFVTILLVAASFAIPYYLLCLLEPYWPAYAACSAIGLFYCIANRTLILEGRAVFDTLKNKGLEAGRQQLSWIVSRDTSGLDSQQIRTATLETMAENLSDGVIAPLFYFLFFGLPGAMAYKMINTLDSMTGYKSDRYKQFGKFAAKLDDLANFVPARLTAIVMLAVSSRLQGLSFVFREAKKHASPNAGYPEAALAYILSCRFGGPGVYHGKRYEKLYIGLQGRNIAHEEIYRVIRINFVSSILFVLMGCLFLWAVQ